MTTVLDIIMIVDSLESLKKLYVKIDKLVLDSNTK